MVASMDDLRNFLSDPQESLGVELKQWIDPTKPEGIAKIAKACIALRNNDGGRLVIGFKNDSRPDVDNVPADVRATFHGDVIQAIVSRYSAELFPIEVQFVDVGGQIYPVILVPPGVRTPVAAKATLNGPDGKPLVRDHAVYVRSLQSNNTVSSTEARRGDWETLTRICFDNREADIGGFVRRHLSALDRESLAALIPALSGSANRPTARDQVIEELDRGRTRFDAAIQKRRVTIPKLGFRETLIRIEGDYPTQSATESFRRDLLLKAPRHTGWPPWVDLQNETDRPYVLDQGWEALVLDSDAQGAFSPGRE
jgi:schlafen family protein